MSHMDKLRLLYDKYGENAKELGSRLGRSPFTIKNIIYGETPIDERLKKEIDDLFELSIRVAESAKLRMRSSGKHS